MNHKLPLENRERTTGLLPYPIDMSQVLEILVPDREALAGNAIVVAQQAFVQWHRYITSADEACSQAFLEQAQWLVEHVSPIGYPTGAEYETMPHLSGWPLSSPHTKTYLSALMQGIGISVLIRAYQLTGRQDFLDVVHRVVRTFETDILDGGVCVPIGAHGVFFEEWAVYPASHSLVGFIFALFGLYDYVQLTGDASINSLLQRALTTMHKLLDEFDAGFWTYTNLLDRELSSPALLTLQAELLDALATYRICIRTEESRRGDGLSSPAGANLPSGRGQAVAPTKNGELTYTGCEHCVQVASRWQGYQRRLESRIRYRIASRSSFYRRGIWKRIRQALFPSPQRTARPCIGIVVPAFPVMGGVLTFLEKINLVTADQWQREYITQHIGPEPAGYVIHRFGSRRMTPWYFPFVWLYVLTGFCKLVWLMHRGARYSVILPQDGIFTGAFAGIAAKLTEVRVVCIDHGDISLLFPHNHQMYRSTRLKEVTAKPWPSFVRLVARQLLVLYWPSRALLARIAAHFIDHYLIPGTSEDGIDDLCHQLGIPRSRITRITNMIEIERHAIPDTETRKALRKRYSIAEDDMVIAIVCRLSPEKGLEIALAAIKQALALVETSFRPHVRVLIVGDGPLREQLEEDIRQQQLSDVCKLWGEASQDEVIAILGISDIFLYTSWRGAGYPLAIMEAMASGCAVIASTEPIANAHLLAEGRGIVVPPGDIEQTGAALVRLLNAPTTCRLMGKLARDHIAQDHNPMLFKRNLMRVIGWTPQATLPVHLEEE